ncbi:hypothetical protein PN823_004435 [Enterobacter hormaechei]|nr:hypothetical protein [Enterobacter hormaechei]
MNQWVKVMQAKGYQVCIEKGVEEGMPAVIFRILKDNGILRSKMCLQPFDSSRDAFDMAKIQRDIVFDGLDISTVNAAVDAMLELEPDLMDGSRHGFVMESEEIKR